MNITATAIEIDQEDNTPQILLMHSNSTEKVTIASIFQDISISNNLDTRLISNLTNTNLQSYDMIIFVSSNEFDLDENVEDRIETFLSDASKFFISFSPFLDEFEDKLEELLGIKKLENIFPKDNVTNWDLKMDVDFGSLTQGSTFSYSGQYAEIEPVSSASTIVSVTDINFDGEFDEEISFPAPAIINATTNKAQIITSTLSPFSSNSLNPLSLNQIPQPFEVLLTEIFRSSINIISQTGKTIITDTKVNENDIDDSPIDKIPLLPDLPFGNFLIYGIILLISLFITKLLGILDWVSRKAIGLGIFIIGAFYSVEDRILDQKDVYLNQSRADIMDFLDTVGKYGSHLREIKSTTHLGSGSLLWHLKVLEDFNWIVKYKIDSFTVYVAYSHETTFDPYVKSLELKLQSKYSFDLIEALLSISFDENIVISDLQDLTGVPNKAIRRFINKLAELDLVKIRSQKPIKFRIYNHSILNNLHESFRLRIEYEVSDNSVNVEEID